MSIAPSIVWYDEIDSTNLEARRRAEAGNTGPAWLAAKHQNAGRGRLGRNWLSRGGNLYATLLMPVPEGPVLATRLPFAAAVAVVRSCLSFVPQLDVRLKWPNDVRIQGAKLCGILVESGNAHNGCWAAIGIGVNLAEAPQIDGQPTTSLVEHSDLPAIAPDMFLSELRTQLNACIAEAYRDFQSVLDNWLEYAEGLGEEISAGPKQAPVIGRFMGLAPDGGLKLRLRNGDEHTIRAGDVELVRHVR